MTWTSHGTVGTVTIAVSLDAGSTWQNLVTGTPNDGSQAATLPNIPSTFCLMHQSLQKSLLVFQATVECLPAANQFSLHASVMAR